MAMIYCPECGAQISDAAYSCPNCGKPIRKAPLQTSPQAQMPPCPESYLVKSILMTVLLCPAFGIPAIVNAVGVQYAYSAGNYQLAVEKSEKAAKWCKYSIVAGIIFYVLYFILIFGASILAEL